MSTPTQTRSTQGAAPAANGTTEKVKRGPRKQKTWTAKTAGMKIAEILGSLDTEARDKALHLAKTLAEFGA